MVAVILGLVTGMLWYASRRCGQCIFVTSALIKESVRRSGIVVKWCRQLDGTSSRIQTSK